MRPLVPALFLPAFFLATNGGGDEVGSASKSRAACSHLPPVTAPRAHVNDNRVAAGIRRGDTLVVSLVIGRATWYPEADSGCGIPMLAFGEAGKQPSVPGPLLRVRAGMPMRISVRNAAGRPLWLRGFHDHPVPSRVGVALPADSAQEFRFTATAPGTYAYGATINQLRPGGAAVALSNNEGSQLVGAFIVDSAGARGAPRDRVMVLTRWAIRDPADTVGPVLYNVAAVNGKSWPYTERFTHTVGDSVQWRVINGGGAPHPMHLHGFYFRVMAKGTFTGDTVLSEPRIVVTEGLTAGQTMQMSWVPERAGNWLFHCHLLVHMAAAQRLDRLSNSASIALGVQATSNGQAGGNGSNGSHVGHGNHATDGMAGLIVGIHVKPARGARASSVRAEAPRRTLRLFANERRPTTPGGVPAYGFVLQEGDRAPARDSVRVPGSPLVLRRGEPTQITVFNRLAMPLSVHWHGLELESFFDGVGDWSGTAGSVAPPIAPGDSFVVRLTPPRAGTFMYHVHGEEGRELAFGLYAPLIVLDGRTAIDTLTDKLLIVSDAGTRREDGVLINGSTAPRITLTAGRPHRLRLIGITSNLAPTVVLTQGADTVEWRLLARDGAELTGAPEPLTQARRLVAPGTIADYEFTPTEAGELTLLVRAGPAPGADPALIARGAPPMRISITVVAGVP